MDKAKQFIVWLDGFLEGRETLDEIQIITVKKKLDSIFNHEAMDSILSTKPTLDELGEIHNFKVHKNTFGGQDYSDNAVYRC